MSAVSPEISQVLAQMRVMQAQAQSEAVRPQTEVQSTVSFGDVLSQSINSVNNTQQTAAALKTSFEMGDPNVSLSEVMIASQKSKLAFSAMVEVRNKFLEAYKEVMNMPV
jgi:flagellar hook-basal body complex protein FliE